MKTKSRKRIWKCPLCKRGTQIGRLHLIAMKFYVAPYSCTGGDYWIVGDRPEYKIHCPKCDRNVREIDSDSRGVGFDGHRGFFSVKRWQLIHTNKNFFASQDYECKN